MLILLVYMQRQYRVSASHRELEPRNSCKLEQNQVNILIINNNKQFSISSCWNSLSTTYHRSDVCVSGFIYVVQLVIFCCFLVKLLFLFVFYDCSDLNYGLFIITVSVNILFLLCLYAVNEDFRHNDCFSQENCSETFISH